MRFETPFTSPGSGTVSGAARGAGRAPRHRDPSCRRDWRERLGVKLFQRHAPRATPPPRRGATIEFYFLQVAQATDDQFTQLIGRIRRSGRRGDGRSRGDPSARFLLAEAHPGAWRCSRPTTRASWCATSPTSAFSGSSTARRMWRIRAGTAPAEPDNVVQPFVDQRLSLFASPRLHRPRGRPSGEADLEHHDFVGLDGPLPRAVRALAARARPGRADRLSGVSERRVEARGAATRIEAAPVRGFWLPRSPAGRRNGRTRSSGSRDAPVREVERTRAWIFTHL